MRRGEQPPDGILRGDEPPIGEGPDPSAVVPGLPPPFPPGIPSSAGPPPEGSLPPAAPAGAGPTDGVDRRSFFRVFSRQTLTAVAEVAGLANAMSRSASAAAGVVELGLGDPRANAQRLAANAAYAPPGGIAALTGTPINTLDPSGVASYRSPFRIVDGTLLVLDQRALPDRLEEVACRRAADVAFQARAMVAQGGPLLAQLAAYGLALTARETAALRPSERRSELRRAVQQLIFARPAARMVRWAVARMERTVRDLGDDATGDAVAAALWAAADALDMEVTLQCTGTARALADLLVGSASGPVHVLVHGNPGAFGAGMVGTALGALQLMMQEGVPLRAWVTEGRPNLEGARLTARELRLAGIDHTVLADTAVAWLLNAEPIDAVLLGADWIAGNGDTANVIGSRIVAELAALGIRDGTPVPVYACAPSPTVAPLTMDGLSIPTDLRPGRELGTYVAGLEVGGEYEVNPAVEIVPAGRITAIVTELGVLRPPYEASIAAAVGPLPPSPRVPAVETAAAAPDDLSDAPSDSQAAVPPDERAADAPFEQFAAPSDHSAPWPDDRVAPPPRGTSGVGDA